MADEGSAGKSFPNLDQGAGENKDTTAPTIQVEVAYALPHQQTVLDVRLPTGSTVNDAIQASGILEHHPQIDLAEQAVGVHGQVTKPQTALRDGDRVEIYRPLLIDPKEARRQRASGQSSSGQ
ncbi:RnfH family protein [Halorhodospira halochloris]|uniref:RnfH family protein n=1 Tax=Halorhodospira halochloris TaxID=1052 RepID=UPI0023794626|nr:RnfH family protein [Halorhodospira halochloris]